MLTTLDAVGLSRFAVSGAALALTIGMHPLTAVLLGTITGVGGGTVRDVLLNEVPEILRADISAVAALEPASTRVPSVSCVATVCHARRMRRVLTALAPVVIACTIVLAPIAGVAASSKDQAGESLRAQFELLLTGQAGRLYKLLHPAQQAIIDRDEYIRCASTQVAGLELKGFEVQDVYKQRVTIPGTNVNAKGYAVVVRSTVSNGLMEQTDTDTFHEFKTPKGWRFAVDDPTRATDC